MRKNNWIVAAIAAVACGVLLWAWFALGFNHVDDPLDLVVAVVWWLAVAAVVGGPLALRGRDIANREGAGALASADLLFYEIGGNFSGKMLG